MTINHWEYLEKHLKILPDEFIIRFLPFFDWRNVKIEDIGYQKMFNILFGKSHQVFEKKARDYFQKNGLIKYIASKEFPHKASFIRDKLFCYIIGKFLEDFPKIPEHLQRLIIDRLWKHATTCGDQYYLYETDSFSNWKNYSLISKILSVDLGEITDKFVGGLMLFRIDDNARRRMCECLNQLGTFGMGRMYRIYKNYIEPSDMNSYESLFGFPKVYDYLIHVKYYGLSNLSTFPGKNIFLHPATFEQMIGL